MPAQDNPDRVEKLIGLVNKYPTLYNPSLVDYRDADIRRNCWLDIQREMEFADETGDIF